MRGSPRIPVLRSAGALLLALVLPACVGGDDQDSAAPPTTPAPPAVTSPSPATSPSPSPSPSPGGDEVVLDASCEMPAPDAMPPVTLHHPAGWEVGTNIARCTYFSPDDVELEPNTEPQGVDVRWSVEPAPFDRVVESGPATRDARRVTGVVDGHRAMRTTAVSTGQALLPEGVRTTTWAVDLSRSADQAATLIGTSHDTDGVDYEQATTVLDAMARELQIGGDGNERDVTVIRWPGRNAFTVAYRPDDQCLELYAGARQGSRVDRVCNIGSAAGFDATVLRGEGLEVAVGSVAPDADVVRLRANTDARRAVATVDVAGNGRVFALPLSGTEATLIAETFDGEQLATHEVLPE